MERRRTSLENFYESVRAAYGSVDAYLREGIGLTDAEFERLRDRYLEE